MKTAQELSQKTTHTKIFFSLMVPILNSSTAPADTESYPSLQPGSTGSCGFFRPLHFQKALKLTLQIGRNVFGVGQAHVEQGEIDVLERVDHPPEHGAQQLAQPDGHQQRQPAEMPAVQPGRRAVADQIAQMECGKAVAHQQAGADGKHDEHNIDGRDQRTGRAAGNVDAEHADQGFGHRVAQVFHLAHALLEAAIIHGDGRRQKMPGQIPHFGQRPQGDLDDEPPDALRLLRRLRADIGKQQRAPAQHPHPPAQPAHPLAGIGQRGLAPAHALGHQPALCHVLADVEKVLVNKHQQRRQQQQRSQPASIDGNGKNGGKEHGHHDGGVNGRPPPGPDNAGVAANNGDCILEQIAQLLDALARARPGEFLCHRMSWRNDSLRLYGNMLHGSSPARQPARTLSVAEFSDCGASESQDFRARATSLKHQYDFSQPLVPPDCHRRPSPVATSDAPCSNRSLNSSSETASTANSALVSFIAVSSSPPLLASSSVLWVWPLRSTRVAVRSVPTSLESMRTRISSPLATMASVTQSPLPLTSNSGPPSPSMRAPPQAALPLSSLLAVRVMASNSTAALGAAVCAGGSARSSKGCPPRTRRA